MYKRLAEAFYFEYMLRSEPDKSVLAEFEIYERFYLAIASLSEIEPTLDLARNMYSRIKEILPMQRLPSEQP
jgi:hypothetical protein